MLGLDEVIDQVGGRCMLVMPGMPGNLMLAGGARSALLHKRVSMHFLFGRELEAAWGIGRGVRIVVIGVLPGSIAGSK